MKVHVFAGENNYNLTLLNLLEKNNLLDDNQFFFRCSDQSKYNYSEKLTAKINYIPNSFSFFVKLLPKLIKADKIFLHYLPYGPSFLFWYLTPFLFKKITWIFWGGDIYVYYDKDKDLRSAVYEYFRKKIIKRIPRIAGYLYGDFEIIQNIYNTNAAYIYTFYPSPINFEFLDQILINQSNKSANTKTIFLGNSATTTNRHIEILEILSQYKEKDILIYCPLSYGNVGDYVQQVVKYGKSVFNEKFIPLLERIPENDYSELIAKTDICIMNHHRQQGLGNILAFLYLEKKVFIRSDTTPSSYFEKIGCKIYDTISLKNLTFNSIFEKEEELYRRNHDILKLEVSEQNCIANWNKVINF